MGKSIMASKKSKYMDVITITNIIGYINIYNYIDL